MENACVRCVHGSRCNPIGTNVTGYEIQAYDAVEGWKKVSGPFPNYCQAVVTLKTYPKDTTERRVYPSYIET